MQTDARTLTHRDLTRIMRQALFAEELVEQCLGRSLVGSATDLELVDQLIERGLVTAHDHYALRCLAVVVAARLFEDLEGIAWFPLDAGGHAYLLHDVASGRLLSPLAVLQARFSSGVSLTRLYEAARAHMRPGARRCLS